MNAPLRLGLYGLVLAVVFAASTGLGRLVGSPQEPSPPPASADHGRGGDDAATPPLPPEGPPGGLLVSDGGYRLAPLTAALTAGAPVDFRFQILGPDGAPVTGYTPTHDRDLHLIVVRRDLSGFQHLHPTLGPDGTWSQRLTVAEAGQYRIFADFQAAGAAEPLTLGVDVPAAGAYQPRPLPEVIPAVTVDGYRVELLGDLLPGAASRLTLRVTRDGAPVTDLEPYLGAYGHLVVLRDGDLAYLHVHPDGEPGDGRTASGPEITFHAEAPTAGAYRLYLDFQHDGVVRTAEFTALAGGTAATVSAPAAGPTPATADPDGPDDQPHGHG